MMRLLRTNDEGSSTGHAGRWLVLALGLALVLRLGAAFYWEANFAKEGFHFGDSDSYWILGRCIANGGPYEFGHGGPKVFRTPGYPILIAPLFIVFGDEPPVIAARIQSVLFGTLAVLGVWLLARRLFGLKAASLAAFLAAVYPGLIALSLPVLTEAPFCALLPFQLLLWTHAFEAESKRRGLALAFATGLLGAAITLIRPSWLLFMPFVVLAGLAIDRRRLRHAWLGAAVMIGVAVGMAPWWIRNMIVTGHFVPTSLQVGASLYDGWNPEATGASDMSYVPKFEAAERRAERDGSADLNETFEYRLDRRMRDAAVDWAKHHPLDVVRLAAIKFARIWNVWPNEPAFSQPIVRLGVTASYLPLLVLGLVGAWQAIRRGWPYVLCFLPAVYLTMMHMIFIGSIRYREPAMLGLIVLAAGAICSFLEQSETGRDRGNIGTDEARRGDSD